MKSAAQTTETLIVTSTVKEGFWPSPQMQRTSAAPTHSPRPMNRADRQPISRLGFSAMLAILAGEQVKARAWVTSEDRFTPLAFKACVIRPGLCVDVLVHILPLAVAKKRGPYKKRILRSAE